MIPAVNKTQVIKIANISWQLSLFKAWLHRMSQESRPKDMKPNSGLWEYSFTEPYAPGWHRTEFLTYKNYDAVGGIRTFEKLNNSPAGPWQDVLVDLLTSGIKVSRFRLLALAPQTEQHWHTDLQSTTPIWRLHIPLLTHSETALEYKLKSGKKESYHLAADGSCYLINVTEEHRVVNYAKNKWRLHLVADPQTFGSGLHFADYGARKSS